MNSRVGQPAAPFLQCITENGSEEAKLWLAKRQQRLEGMLEKAWDKVLKDFDPMRVEEPGYLDKKATKLISHIDIKEMHDLGFDPAYIANTARGVLKKINTAQALKAACSIPEPWWKSLLENISKAFTEISGYLSHGNIARPVFEMEHLSPSSTDRTKATGYREAWKVYQDGILKFIGPKLTGDGHSSLTIHEIKVLKEFELAVQNTEEATVLFHRLHKNLGIHIPEDKRDEVQNGLQLLYSDTHKNNFLGVCKNHHQDLKTSLAKGNKDSKEKQEMLDGLSLLSAEKPGQVDHPGSVDGLNYPVKAILEKKAKGAASREVTRER